MGTVAVVGGGAAAAGVAHALRDGGQRTVVLERADSVGGRAATTSAHGCTYDHAANYLTGGDDRVDAVAADVGGEDLDLTRPIWTIDDDGGLSPGRPQEQRRWSYADGLQGFVRRVFDRTGASVRTDAGVSALDPDGTLERSGEEGWRLAVGEERVTAEAVVVTPPAPETAALLAESAATDERVDAAAAAARSVSYRPLRSVVLGYPVELDRPWYALVDPEGSHDLGWLAREECKRGHVPDGESVLVAQPSPDWSRAQFETPLPDAADAVAGMVADLLDDDRLRDPRWVDGSRWRHALPNAGAPAGPLERCAEVGLFFAGDWVAGAGRVHAALRSGLDAGDRVREWI